jgi:hypothetical protein
MEQINTARWGSERRALLDEGSFVSQRSQPEGKEEGKQWKRPIIIHYHRRTNMYFVRKDRGTGNRGRKVRPGVGGGRDVSSVSWPRE